MKTWYKPSSLFRQMESNLPVLVLLDCCASMTAKARDFETLTDLVLTSNAFTGKPSRESVQGLVRTCLKMCAVDLAEAWSPALFNERSMQLGLSTGCGCRPWKGWNLETKSRRDRCSSEPRSARPKVLIASPPCSIVLEITELQ